MANIATLLGHSAKIAGISTLLLATFFIWAYTSRVSAPFPTLDASFGMFASVYALIFVWIFSTLGGMFLFPMIIRRLFTSEAIKIRFPSLCPEDPWSKRSIRFWKFVKDYLVFYAPILGFIFAIEFDVLWDSRTVRNLIRDHVSMLQASTIEYIIPISIIVLAIVSGVVVLFLGNRDSRSKILEIIPKKGKLALRAWGCSMAGSGISFLWVIFMYTFIMRLSPNPTGIFTASFFVIIIFIHMLINWVPFGLRSIAILSFTILVEVSFVYPGPAYLGGLTLRMLGAGGGIPATILMQASDRSQALSGVRQVSGCIVLNVGSELMFTPVEDLSSCQSVRVPIWSVLGREKYPETYTEVEVLNRKEVLRVHSESD